MRDAGHRVRGARVARLIRRSVADPWRVFFFPFRFGLSSSRPPLGSLGSARGREHDTRRSMITQTIVLTKACGQTTIDYNSMRPHGWTGSFPRFVFFFCGCVVLEAFFPLGIPKVQGKVNLIDLVNSFRTSIWLRNLASISPRTSPLKLDSETD